MAVVDGGIWRLLRDDLWRTVFWVVGKFPANPVLHRGRREIDTSNGNATATLHWHYLMWDTATSRMQVW